MLFSVEHLEVFWVIVRSAMIDVVNVVYALDERSTYFVLSNKAMLLNVAPEACKVVVRRILQNVAMHYDRIATLIARKFIQPTQAFVSRH